MPEYMKMYFQLAAKVADTIDSLQKALQQGESDFMEMEPQVIRIAVAKEESDDRE